MSSTSAPAPSSRHDAVQLERRDAHRGRVINRSAALQKRREEFAANARPVGAGTSTIYDWTTSLTASPIQLKAFDGAIEELHDAVSVGNHEVWGDPLPSHLQYRKRDEEPEADTADAHTIAKRGVGGPGSPLPHGEVIQKAFGRHDLSDVKAHLGGHAQEASAALGAEAYATGSDIAFAGTPTLHTAAHEAAHIIQQRAGVSLKDGIGESGDRYERHADEVADAVVRGQSAEPILDRMTCTPGTRPASIQFETPLAERGSLQPKSDKPSGGQGLDNQGKADGKGGPSNGSLGDASPQEPSFPTPPQWLKGKNDESYLIRFNTKGDKLVVEVNRPSGFEPATEDELEQLGLAGFSGRDPRTIDLKSTVLSRLEDINKLDTGINGLAALSEEERRQQVESAIKTGWVTKLGGGKFEADYKVPRLDVTSPILIFGMPLGAFFKFEGSFKAGLFLPSLSEGKEVSIDPHSLTTKVETKLGADLNAKAEAGVTWGLPCAVLYGGLSLTASLAVASTLTLELEFEQNRPGPHLRGAKVKGDAGVEGKLSGVADVGVMFRLGRFDEKISLIEGLKGDYIKASLKPAAFSYDLATPSTAPTWEIDPNNKDNYKVDFSAFKPESGIFGDLVRWLKADDDANERVKALKESGLLVHLTPAQRAELGTDLFDSYIGREHAQSFDDLYRAAGDAEARIQFLRQVADKEGRSLTTWQDHLDFIDAVFRGELEVLTHNVDFKRHQAFVLTFRSDAVAAPQCFDLDDATLPVTERAQMQQSLAVIEAQEERDARIAAQDRQDRHDMKMLGAPGGPTKDAAGNPISGIQGHKSTASGTVTYGQRNADGGYTHSMFNYKHIGISTDMLIAANVWFHGDFVAVPRGVNGRDWLLEAMGYKSLGFGDRFQQAVWRNHMETQRWTQNHGLWLVVGLSNGTLEAIGRQLDPQPGAHGRLRFIAAHQLVSRILALSNTHVDFMVPYDEVQQDFIGVPDGNSFEGWFPQSKMRQALKATPVSPSPLTFGSFDVTDGERSFVLSGLDVELLVTDATTLQAGDRTGKQGVLNRYLAR